MNWIHCSLACPALAGGAFVSVKRYRVNKKAAIPDRIAANLLYTGLVGVIGR
jgi:hypothetical protein